MYACVCAYACIHILDLYQWNYMIVKFIISTSSSYILTLWIRLYTSGCVYYIYYFHYSLCLLLFLSTQYIPIFQCMCACLCPCLCVCVSIGVYFPYIFVYICIGIGWVKMALVYYPQKSSSWFQSKNTRIKQKLQVSFFLWNQFFNF